MKDRHDFFDFLLEETSPPFRVFAVIAFMLLGLLAVLT
jgi:hypothetical protein